MPQPLLRCSRPLPRDKNACWPRSDGIQLHTRSGYLFDPFPQGNGNRRARLYGGFWEDRARFLAEVAEDVIRVRGT
ncbi:oxidoreductase [Thermostichus sp. OS-CIW-31]